MTIENAKKIEVWQFEDDRGFLRYVIPDGVIFYDDEDSNYKYADILKEKKIRQHFAELKAKEQESELIYFKYQNNRCRRRKDGVFEYFNTLDNAWWECTKGVFSEYYEANKDSILKANEKPKQEAPASTAEKLLEFIHNLEKRIEDLEAERARLVHRTNDIYARINSAKLTL